MSVWDKLFKDGAKATLKQVRMHNSQKSVTLSQHTKKTLGSGNLKKAVQLPSDELPEKNIEDINEWLASNAVDFFNELSLLYGLCTDDAEKYKEPGTGFPSGFEYRWSDPSSKSLKPLRVSGPEYVDFAMTWIGDQFDNPSIFPELESQSFPSEFQEYVKDIFKKMFRIFAIIYHCHFDVIEKFEAIAHLNTIFKHFLFFVLEFNLIVDEKELLALKGPVTRISKEFEEATA